LPKRLADYAKKSKGGFDASTSSATGESCEQNTIVELVARQQVTGSSLNREKNSYNGGLDKLSQHLY